MVEREREIKLVISSLIGTDACVCGRITVVSLSSWADSRCSSPGNGSVTLPSRIRGSVSYINRARLFLNRRVCVENSRSKRVGSMLAMCCAHTKLVGLSVRLQRRYLSPTQKCWLRWSFLMRNRCGITGLWWFVLRDRWPETYLHEICLVLPRSGQPHRMPRLVSIINTSISFTVPTMIVGHESHALSTRSPHPKGTPTTTHKLRSPQATRTQSYRYPHTHEASLSLYSLIHSLS